MRQGFDTFMNAEMMHDMLDAKMCNFYVYIFYQRIYERTFVTIIVEHYIG